MNRNTKKFLTVVLTLTLCTFFLSEQGLAYTIKKWDGEKVNWCGGQKPWLNISTLSFPDGSDTQDALIEAIDLWNTNITSFYFQTEFSAFDTYDVDNGYVEVGLVDPTTDPNIKSAPAVAMMLQDSSDGDCLYDADVLFSTNVNWTTSHDKKDHMEYAKDGKRSLQTTALHEFGHVLGLQHEDDYYNIMGTDWKHASVNADDFNPLVGADAQAGSLYLYGLTGDADSLVSDWTVSHEKYSATATGSSEYANSVRTVIYNSLTGAELDWVPFDEIAEKDVIGVKDVLARKAYKVYPGQPIDPEFTIQASVKTPGDTVLLLSVLSDDAAIDEGDQHLAMQGVSCDSNNCVETRTIESTIPADAATGFAYVGMVVNHQQQMDEYNFDNNATYIPVMVEQPPLAVEFTVTDPLVSSAQKVSHLGEVTVVSNQLNTLKLKPIWDASVEIGVWDIDIIYHDFKKNETKVVSEVITSHENIEITLENVSDGYASGGNEHIYLRLSNYVESFGVTFNIEGQIVPYQKPGSVIPGKPENLFQKPINGLVNTSKSYKNNSVVDFSLQATTGNVPALTYGPFTLTDTCQIKYTIVSKNKPYATPHILWSAKGFPTLTHETIFNGELEQGNYRWQAQTVCGIAGSPFMAYKESAAVEYKGVDLVVGKSKNQMCQAAPSKNPSIVPGSTSTKFVDGDLVVTASAEDLNCDPVIFKVRATQNSSSCGLPDEVIGTYEKLGTKYVSPENPLTSLTVTGSATLDFDPEWGFSVIEIQAIDLKNKQSPWVKVPAIKGDCAKTKGSPFFGDPKDMKKNGGGPAGIPGGAKDTKTFSAPDTKNNKAKGVNPGRFEKGDSRSNPGSF